MAQPDPGKHRNRYPQNVGNPRQPRASQLGPQGQMIPSMAVQMPFAGNPAQMGAQQQYAGSPVAAQMYSNRVAQYPQGPPYAQQGGYYYPVPNQPASHMYAYTNQQQYSGSVYGIPNSMGQVPTNPAPQVSVQQMPVNWQQHNANTAAPPTVTQVLPHSTPAPQHQPTSTTQKQRSHMVKLVDPGTGQDVMSEVLAVKARAHGGPGPKQEAAEPSAISTEEMEKQKKLEAKAKAIADFKRKVAEKINEDSESTPSLGVPAEADKQPDKAAPSNDVSSNPSGNATEQTENGHADSLDLAAKQSNTTVIEQEVEAIDRLPEKTLVGDIIAEATSVAAVADDTKIIAEDNTVGSACVESTSAKSDVVAPPCEVDIPSQIEAAVVPTVAAETEKVPSASLDSGIAPAVEPTAVVRVEAAVQVETAVQAEAAVQVEAAAHTDEVVPANAAVQPEAAIPPTTATAGLVSEDPQHFEITSAVEMAPPEPELTVTSADDSHVDANKVETLPVASEEKVPTPAPVEVPESDNGKAPVEEEEATSEASSVVQAPKKKKQKQRMKEMSAKGEREANGNLMDAFVDKPVEEVTAAVGEPKENNTVVHREDETWEEKEEFEVIQKRNQKRESPSDVVNSEENAEEDGENGDRSPQKLHYTRKFLLQYKDYSSKPEGFPNDVEIVLKTPHNSTDLSSQDQRPDINDFAPGYGRQQSGGGGGGRHSGAGRQRGGGRSSFVPPAQPKKIIVAASTETIVLHKSENKWVRGSEQKKDATDQDADKEEVGRKIRGILNKLTPQNFSTLLDQMKALKMDSLALMQDAIEIIFDKAISEPGFSVAYAKMCLELSEMRIVEGAKNFTFRAVLLNRCQREFMKDRDMEVEMLADKDKKYDNAEDERLGKEMMELKEMKARRHALGNVRFIGELYKLKMLKDNIMHECVVTLLNKNDEEYLEWLSKLLATVGKGLSVNQDSAAKVTQYFAKITMFSKDKKISSRVRFMLQDLIELKGNHWVPRREDNNPKTIDQFREDRKNQAKQSEIAAAVRMHDRGSGGRNRGGGRDNSGMNRGGNAQGGGDGWTSVRKTKAPPTQVDLHKFKSLKSHQMSNNEVSLGPARGHQTWAKGASGGSASFGNGPPPAEARGYNRYDVLNSADGHGRDDSRERQRQSKRDPEHERERAAAIAATREMARPSRSHSPVVKSSDQRQKTITDERQTTSSPSVEPIVTMSTAKLENLTASTVDEYLCNADDKEALQCIVDLNATSQHHAVCTKIIYVAIEKRLPQCKQIGSLLNVLLNGPVSREAFCEGLKPLMSQSSDFIVDIPHLWNMLGALLAPSVISNAITLSDIRKTAESSLDSKNALGLCMAGILAAVVMASNEQQALEIWKCSGMEWDSLIKSKNELNALLLNKKLTFTVDGTPQFPSALCDPAGGNKDKIVDWLKANVPNASEPNKAITQDLCMAILKASIVDGKSFSKDSFEKYSSIMLQYITPHSNCKMNLLLSAQQLADSLDYPKALLCEIFECLYDIEIIEEKTVLDWISSKDVSCRKNMAMQDVKPFLDWIKSADEHPSTESK